MSVLMVRKLLLGAILCAVCHAVASAAEPAGEIEFARGAATAQGEAKPARLLGQGQRFYAGEVLTTSKKSFAVIKLIDGSRMTLRPDTQFVVESINAEKGRGANATLQLFKGGIRALTGFISKYNKNGYKLKTPVATIGIRGTEFDARLCQGDCEAESGQESLAAVFRSARVSFARGQISLRLANGSQTPIKTGEDIQPGQKIQSGNNGIAVLVFPDNSRVTLQPRSEFVIRDYSYDKQNPKASLSVLQLLRGGLRVATGLIGKLAPDNYRVQTPVATIGIRGTGFDLLCKNACIEVASSLWQPENILDRLFAVIMKPAYAVNLPSNGMYAYVWSGKIRISIQNDTFDLGKDQAVFVANSQSKPIPLPAVPKFILDNPFPRPDNVIADPEKMFTKIKSVTEGKAGLYVSVYDGEVEVQNKKLKPGDASFTDPTAGITHKLPEMPKFMTQDSFPKPADFKPSVYRLLNVIDRPQESFECELQ